MPLPLVLALVFGASAPTASVLDLYREACVDGQLQLIPQRGEFVDSTRMPDIIFNSDISAEPRHTVLIRMKQPKNTFVMIEQFDPSPRTKFESICKVASTQWTESDARRAFIAGVANPKVLDMRDSGHPFEPYVIDQPAAGVRKRMFVHDDWVMIETGIYRERKSPAEAPKEGN